MNHFITLHIQTETQNSILYFSVNHALCIRLVIQFQRQVQVSFRNISQQKLNSRLQNFDLLVFPIQLLSQILYQFLLIMNNFLQCRVRGGGISQRPGSAIFQGVDGVVVVVVHEFNISVVRVRRQVCSQV